MVVSQDVMSCDQDYASDPCTLLPPISIVILKVDPNHEKQTEVLALFQVFNTSSLLSFAVCNYKEGRCVRLCHECDIRWTECRHGERPLPNSHIALTIPNEQGAVLMLPCKHSSLQTLAQISTPHWMSSMSPCFPLGNQTSYSSAGLQQH